MTATLTIHAPELSKAQVKACRKAEKKRHNNQLDALGSGLDNLTTAIYGAQDCVAQARTAVKNLDPTAPSQELRDFFNELEALLARGMEMTQQRGKAAQEAVTEHYFPGRAAKWAAEDEQRNLDHRYAQSERQFAA